MKRLFLMFEDLWVAVAFAESGYCELDEMRPLRLEIAPTGSITQPARRKKCPVTH